MRQHGAMTEAAPTDRVLIVGAGPAGLATARAFQRAGVPFEIVERHRDVGGIWDLENPGTPIYESAQFISSKTLSGFADFPMPAEYPDYPTRRQILDYIRAYAHNIGAYEHIRFGAEVTHAIEKNSGWEVTTSDGEVRHYRALVVANGHQWDPSRPDIPGLFNGTIIHSREYKNTTTLRGKRVLIVGGGNSGVDIACDAAGAATTAAISLRRGYWFIPKHIFGMPSDVFAHTGPQLPTKVQQFAFARMLNVLVGKPEKFGLPKPDHKLFESHPILNDQIFHYLSHGDLHAVPDVARFDGDDVVFVDGSREAFDLVILATGYHVSAPFLSPEVFSEPPDLFLNVASRTSSGLFFVGIFEIAGAAYELMGTQADLIAAALQATTTDTGWRQWHAMRRERPDIVGPVHYVKSPRHDIYVDADTYPKILREYTARLAAPTP
jgi:hypothetical protein